MNPPAHVHAPACTAQAWSLCNLLTLFITANGAWLFFDKRRVRKLHPAMAWSEA